MASPRSRRPDARKFERVPGHWAVLFPEPVESLDEGEILDPDAVEERFTKRTAEALEKEGWSIVVAREEPEPPEKKRKKKKKKKKKAPKKKRKAPRRKPSLEAGDLPEQAQEAVPVYHCEDCGNEPVFGTWRVTVVLRKLKGEDARDHLEEMGYVVVREHRWSPSAFAVRVDRDREAFEVAEEIAEDDEVEWAFPELMFQVGESAGFVPPSLPPGYVSPLQWQWSAVEAVDTWTLTRGGGTRIAVIDQGFDANHSDLAGGVDVNASGFFPVLGNVAFQGGLASLAGTGVAPHLRHGTAAAGMAAARPQPNAGLSGAAPDATLILIAVGTLSTASILADAFCHAVEPWVEAPGVPEGQGADVVSCSLFSASTQYVVSGDPIDLALDRVRKVGRSCMGAPFCWAVANTHALSVSADAVGSRSDVIAVGATDWKDEATNATGVTLVAPGKNVYSTVPPALVASGEDYVSGTSFAAPAVAGVAALVLSVNPHLTADEVETILVESCDKIQSGLLANYVNGIDPLYGSGRVNALKAVETAISWLSPWRFWRHLARTQMCLAG